MFAPKKPGFDHACLAVAASYPKIAPQKGVLYLINPAIALVIWTRAVYWFCVLLKCAGCPVYIIIIIVVGTGTGGCVTHFLITRFYRK